MRLDYAKAVRLRKQGATISSIAAACSCGWEAARDAIDACCVAWGGLVNVPDGATDAELRAKIAGGRAPKAPDTSYLQVDVDAYLAEYRRGARKKDLWADYLLKASAGNLKAYKPSRFNELLLLGADHVGVAFPMERIPGLKCEVDWVGDDGHFTDRDTGELVKVRVFVIVLPYSGYFYCEGFPDEKMPSWLQGHVNGFKFFGGTPATCVPDNCRTATDKGRRSHYEEVVLNRVYAEFAEHYNITIQPARIRKPKDKSVCERTVQIVEKDLMAPLEDMDIFSLEEYNRLLHAKLVERLKAEYSKRYGSRESVFLEEEKKELCELPVLNYGLFETRKSAVGRDSYIQVGKAFYSVPAPFIGKRVTVRVGEGLVMVYDDGNNLIARHGQAERQWQRVKDKAHFVEGLENYGGYTVGEFTRRAAKLGPDLTRYIEWLAKERPQAQDSFRTIDAILKACVQCPDNEAVAMAARESLKCRLTSCKQFRALLDAKTRQAAGERAANGNPGDSLFDI